MNHPRPRLALSTIALVAVVLLVPAITGSGAPPAGPLSVPPSNYVYLPLVVTPICRATSGNSYTHGPATQYDVDDPVRLAWNHADKNLALRGYTPNTSTNYHRSLVDYGLDDKKAQPPQFPTLFDPPRHAVLSGFYQVRDWNWVSSKIGPGTPGAPLADPPITALGLLTTPGEVLRVPSSGYSIGQGMEVLVIFADQDSVTLRYTREDSSASHGYTVHVDNICTDPNLLALYRSLDRGKRYEFHYRGWVGYDLPTLPAGKPIGRARDTEIVVAIVDTGKFMDPRSCKEWWQGYSGPCPIHE